MDISPEIELLLADLTQKVEKFGDATETLATEVRDLKTSLIGTLNAPRGIIYVVQEHTKEIDKINKFLEKQEEQREKKKNTISKVSWGAFATIIVTIICSLFFGWLQHTLQNAKNTEETNPTVSEIHQVQD